MALFRLNVAIPDRPGSLGLLASAIGAAGGDIRALAVVKSEDGRGYDDITVAVPGRYQRQVVRSTMVRGMLN